MSMFSITGEVRDVTLESGFLNKETGERGADYYSVHILGDVPKAFGSGTKPQVVELRIPSGMDLQPFRGKNITIQTSAYAGKHGVVYSVFEGSKPVVNSPPPLPSKS